MSVSMKEIFIAKFTPEEILKEVINREMKKGMKNKGLLHWHPTKERIEVYSDWVAIFSVSGLDDQLWQIHKAGNRQMVRERLPKVLKKIAFEDLKAKLIAYLKWCDQTERSKKDLSTWLNPEKQFWNDPVGAIRPTHQIATPEYKAQAKVKTRIIK